MLAERESCLTGRMEEDERRRKRFRLIATTAVVVTVIVVGHLAVFLLLGV